MILLLACAGDPPPPLAAPAEVWVEARKVDAGAPVVLHAPATTALPAVENLTFTQRTVADDGSATWNVTGPAGSYLIEIPTSAGPARLYVDIGVAGPTGGPMDDLVGLPEPPPPVWPYLLGGAVALGALGVGGWYAWQRWKPVPPPPPAVPAFVIARREWAALRARSDLAPDVLALELSGVVRRYFEAAHRWPATSRTSREILDALAGDLSAAEHASAKRLLGAMDLVKFADREDHAALFSTFDEDFERILRGARA